MARPRAEDYDAKRLAILAGAAGVLAAHGYDRSSMSLIAEACGVSKASLYHYYTGKDDIVHDIIRQHLDRLIHAVHAADPGVAGAPEQRLGCLVEALLEAYRDATNHHVIQINDLKRLPQDWQDALLAKQRGLVGLFTSALLDASPNLRASRPQLTAAIMSLFGMLNWHYLWFREDGPMSRADYAALATRIIIEGTRSL